jgi:DNA-binding PadR family transcriptional regulator
MIGYHNILMSDHSGLPRSAFLILLALADGPSHGLGIIARVEDATRGAIKLGPGTLYGTIKILAADGLIRESAAPTPADADTRRRFFRLTSRGARALSAEAGRLRVLVEAAATRRVVDPV